MLFDTIIEHFESHHHHTLVVSCVYARVRLDSPLCRAVNVRMHMEPLEVASSWPDNGPHELLLFNIHHMNPVVPFVRVCKQYTAHVYPSHSAATEGAKTAAPTHLYFGRSVMGSFGSTGRLPCPSLSTGSAATWSGLS